MSNKKKRKNSNYQTNKTKQIPQKKQSAHEDRPNALTLTLAVVIVIIALVGTFFIVRSVVTDPNTAPTVPTDQNPAGNDVNDMAEYLKEKYGMEFLHEFTTGGASVFSADGLPGMVQIMRKEIIHELNPENSNLFTEKYADNGYLIVNMQKGADFYKDKISLELGNHRFLVYSDIIANPSKVTASTPYEQYLNATKSLSIPDLIIVTDKTLSEKEKQTLEAELNALKMPLKARVFTLSADVQNSITPSDIMQLTAMHKDVQYYKIFNAENLLGK